METCFIVDYGGYSVKSGFLAGKKRTDRQQSVVTTSDSRFTQQQFAPPPFDAEVAISHVAELMEASSIAPASTTLVFLLPHPTALPRLQREGLVKAAFEGAAVSKLYLGYGPVCALFGTGAHSGTVVDVGHTGTRVVPIVDGQPVSHGVVTSEVGGAAQSFHLARILRENHRVPAEALVPSTLHALKVAVCGREREQLLQSQSQQATQSLSQSLLMMSVPLPDGQIMKVPLAEAERAEVARVLLHPAATLTPLFDTRNNISAGGGVPPLGVAEAAACTIRTLFAEFPSACQEWALCGGAALVDGFEAELRATLASVKLPRISGSGSGSVECGQRPVRDPLYAAWVGGSVVSQLSSFGAFCIDRAMYHDEGPRGCLHSRSVDRH